MTNPAESSAPEANSDPWIGRVLAGRYRIDARLGSGGMGAVYRARHLALDREVAIKILHARLTEDPVVARRFDREALAASRLDHPGIVQMLDAGTAEGGTKFLVMQLLSGRELRSLQDGPMPSDRVVELTLQILRALEHAHRRGLVHRDLKPENVIVTRDDEDREVVKILDFGIVKLLSGEGDDDKLTRAGMVFGTPRYMSPEQAAGGKIDARADLYTVGVIMYEMLAGSPPFQGDEMGIVLRMHILADPPPLPEHVPAPIAEVVMRLLQKRPVDRFGSAKETEDALQAAATQGATGIPPMASPAMASSAMASPMAYPTMPTQGAGSSQPTWSTALPPSGVAHTVLAIPTPVPMQPQPRRRTGMLGPIVALVVLAIAMVIGWAALSGPGERAPTIETERPILGEGATPPAVGAALGTTGEHATADDTAPQADPDRERREREASKKREKRERDARKRAEKRGRKGRKQRDGRDGDD
jgi:serine/threonine protein kinase